ncbi:Deleted in malignant brain tumors 1 protein [Exaiptasia diaphana]|nr:Deleted in malignant brain tumors 1 protein [Exaiptasia diaphana]
MDSTLKYLSSPTKNVQRFSVQAFRFLGKYRHVYFHCHVIACNGNDAKSVCSRGCNKKKIGKRNAEGSDAAVMLSRGPLATRENKIAEVVGHKIHPPKSQDNSVIMELP